ncbi:uncharacterized protein Z518_03399 [Rhinocladiella mackenziei CBS 650.93]|uniref:J domain-containing protein n=1 Tax=Rhinocladiella mackenziei CBS 650.93 TaxID=1442369 RepID=A0A0D2G2H3_9EURO|nr:uncharacterized protein Z518_03399 [Rhinocladiella mackenziei CBS 650.93]KIX08742.1 hypothetical protein Z518_03399 [Rhinocladiella mackenziei CBS 650.93]
MIYAQNPFTAHPEDKIWDPHATFSIINPDRDAFTCVGYARTQGRRCRNPIDQHDRKFVYDLLDRISSLSPGSGEVAKLLPQIASLSLCRRWHKDQADSIVRNWATRISMLPQSPPREGKTKTKDRKSKIFEARPDPTTFYHSSFEGGNPKQHESGARNQKQQRGEQQRPDREKEEQQKREQEAKEQKRREEDAREKMREKARQQREERERETREQAMRERREWQQAWHSYVTKWTTFKQAKTKPSNPQQAQQLIPWPTKSGRFRDLTKSNVMTFYRNACPDAGTPAMSKAMRAESLKWHPDKMSILYPSCEPGAADKEVILMICRVVLGLKEQADAMRAR